MTSRRQRYLDLVRTRRYATAANVAAVLIGAGLPAGGVVRASAVGPDASDWLQTTLALGGSALVSAGLIGLVLGWATKRETTSEIEHAVNLSMEEVLTPFREAIYDDALCSYRWDCHLAPPEAGDPLPDYAHQAVRLAYQLPYLPNELRAICVASTKDGVLEPFVGDERYVFRWLVDDHLDPSDPRIFAVGDFAGRPRALLGAAMPFLKFRRVSESSLGGTSTSTSESASSGR